VLKSGFNNESKVMVHLVQAIIPEHGVQTYPTIIETPKMQEH
jgi:hypothetical protein